MKKNITLTKISKQEEKKVSTTELVMILDRSGSMSRLVGDTIGGFNSMIEKQKKQAGDCWVTTYLFDDKVELLHDRIPLDQVKPMTEQEYYVRGCTALFDAVGGAIEHVDKIHRYIRPQDVPESTVFVIITDGMENASIRFTSKQVKATIEERKAGGWEFLFLGANIDAVETAANIGISRNRAANYVPDAQGSAKVYEGVSNAIGQVRMAGPMPAGWCAGIDADYAARKNSQHVDSFGPAEEKKGRFSFLRRSK